jgi:hypothetical protein
MNRDLDDLAVMARELLTEITGLKAENAQLREALPADGHILALSREDPGFKRAAAWLYGRHTRAEQEPPTCADIEETLARWLPVCLQEVLGGIGWWTGWKDDGDGKSPLAPAYREVLEKVRQETRLQP